MRVSIRFSDVRLAGVALLVVRAIGGTGKRIEGVKRGVQSSRGFVRRCCFGFSLSCIAACTTITHSFDTTPFLREQITGDTWASCLAREYQTQARYQLKKGRNWSVVIALAAKGRNALQKQPIEMDAPIPSLAMQFADLNSSLQKMANPCACAGLQATLDAWVIAHKQDENLDRQIFQEKFTTTLEQCRDPSLVQGENLPLRSLEFAPKRAGP